MSLPLTVPMGAFGGYLGWNSSSRLPRTSAAMFLVIPGAGLTFGTTAKPQMYEVRSSVEINASPEHIWKRVVSFPDLAEPTEWYFRAGIAYPERARIEGRGPGAVHCEFSTGPFVEPIN